MSRLIAYILLLNLVTFVAAEDSIVEDEIDQVSLDLMIPPSCPAAIMLGISPSQIVRPSNVSDFAVYISDVSEGFTEVPQDFAVQVAPFWMFGGGRNMSFPEFADNDNMLQNILQTLSVSVASRGIATDSITTRALSIGLGFTPARGTFSESGFNLYDALKEAESIMEHVNTRTSDLWLEMVASDTEIREWEQLLGDEDADEDSLYEKLIDNRRNIYYEMALQQAEQEMQRDLDHLDEIIEGIPAHRTGFKLDIAAGFVFDIPELSFDDGELQQIGVWGTGGYEWNQGFLMTGARYRHDASDSDLSCIDVGASVGCTSVGLLEVSGEYLSRIFVGSEDIENQWRAILGVSYRVWKHASVAFSFGRDFGEKGSLVSSLSVGLALGTDRPGSL